MTSRVERQAAEPRPRVVKATARAWAALGAAGCFLLVGCTTSSSTTLANGPTSTPSGMRPVSGAGPSGAAAARARVADLVDEVVVPPGATEVSAPPVQILGQPPFQPVSPYLVQAHRLWVLDSPLADVAAWFQENAPAHEGVEGRSALRGRLTSESLRYADDVTVTLAPLAHGRTGVRADAQVIWTPRPTPGEHIPDTVTAARLVAYRLPHHVIAQRRVGAAEARRLAALVDDLQRDTRGVHGCLADLGFRAQVRFSGPGGPYVVEDFPACLSIGVTVRGVRQPGLAYGAQLDRAVLAALGLTPNVRPRLH